MPKVAVVFDLEIGANGEMPDGADLAVFLDSAMAQADRDNPPDTYRLTLARVFTEAEPLTVVVDATGGIFECAFAEAPVDVVLFDTQDAANFRTSIPDPYVGDAQGVEIKAWTSVVAAEVDPIVVQRITEALDDPAKSLVEEEEEVSD